MMYEEKPIEYWREIYLEHANTLGYKQRIEKARDESDKVFHTAFNWQINVSGGKDSLVLWHMCYQLKRFIAVNYCDEILLDHTQVYKNLQNVSQKFTMPIEIVNDPTPLWSIIKSIGKETTDYRSRIEKSDRQWLTDEQKARNIECVVLGMRAEESNGRRLNYKKNGHLYHNKGLGIWIAQPLAHLSTKDIFAYLFQNEIPIPELYFWTKFYDSPERIRVDWLIPLEGEYHQQHAWIKHYFPDFWQKLCDINPKFRAYV